VGLRYIFNRPIPGALEVVEYMMAVMVPFALTVTAFSKAHIGVDIDHWSGFPPGLSQRCRLRDQLDGLLDLYTAITWQNFLNIAEQYDSGMTSAVLLIPHYPFVASLTAAFALLSLIALMHFFENLSEVVSQWTRS
jgi:TRAP-type C4-dicarboxylate transport system permease small subunit